MPLWKVYRDGTVCKYDPLDDEPDGTYRCVFSVSEHSAKLRVGSSWFMADHVPDEYNRVIPVTHMGVGVDARDHVPAYVSTSAVSFAAKPNELGPLAKSASRIAEIVQKALDGTKAGAKAVKLSREEAEELYQLSDYLDSRLETY